MHSGVLKLNRLDSLQEYFIYFGIRIYKIYCKLKEFFSAPNIFVLGLLIGCLRLKENNNGGQEKRFWFVYSCLVIFHCQLSHFKFQLNYVMQQK